MFSSYTLVARAVDHVGNATVSAPVTVTVNNDATPPRVRILAPKAGKVIVRGAAIKVAAADTGAGVAAIEARFCPGRRCSFDRGTPIGIDRAAPYAVRWTKLPADGTCTLLARAVGSAGRAATSAPVTVTVGNSRAAGAVVAEAEKVSRIDAPRADADEDAPTPAATASEEGTPDERQRRRRRAAA